MGRWVGGWVGREETYQVNHKGAPARGELGAHARMHDFGKGLFVLDVHWLGDAVAHTQGCFFNRRVGGGVGGGGRGGWNEVL